MSDTKFLNHTPKSNIEYVIIVVCTYKRPEKLERLLESLRHLNYPNCKTDILIVDNDIEKSAKKIYEKFEDKLNILYTVEEKTGFSNVRNCALKKSIELGATHLAFIDDDEIADKNWLINHIDFYNKFDDIYVSSGPTYKKFNKDYPDYIRNSRTFKVLSHKKLGQFKKSCASGNVFFPLDIVSENNIFFSELFNNSGSEDTDFFGRISSSGYNIGWNFNAVNFEIIEEERANIKWILKRAFHNGYCVSVEKFVYKKNKIRVVIYIFEKFFTVLLDILVIPFSIIKGLTSFFDSFIRLFKNFGKFLGAVMTLANLKPLKRGTK